MIGFNTHYLGKVQLSDHKINKTITIKNVLLSSPSAISADIQQSFIRASIIDSLQQQFHRTLDTVIYPVAENRVHFKDFGQRLADDLIPFVEFSIETIDEIQYNELKNDSNITQTFAGLDMFSSITAVKRYNNYVAVTAMLKPKHYVVKDGRFVDRIFSKHSFLGAVSSIIMESEIKRVGLTDFDKLQSLIARIPQEIQDPVIWDEAEIMEHLYGESAQSWAS